MGAGFPPDCPPGFLGGLPLMPKLRANQVMVAGADLRLGGVTRYGCDPFFLSARGSFCRISLRVHHHRSGLDSNQRRLPPFGCVRGAIPWHCRPPNPVGALPLSYRSDDGPRLSGVSSTALERDTSRKLLRAEGRAAPQTLRAVLRAGIALAGVAGWQGCCGRRVPVHPT
ncbi:hypothetical protein D3C72_1866080 [compost metagenome]